MEHEQFVCSNDVLLFYLKTARLKTNKQGEAEEHLSVPFFKLLIAMKGQAEVSSEECSWRLLPGTALLLPPECSFKVQNELEHGLTYHCLEFTAIGMQRDTPSRWNGETMAELEQVITYPLSRTHKCLETIMKIGKSNDHFLSGYKIQLQFQELMLLLIEHNEQGKGIQNNDTKLVEETIHFMQTCYQQRITVQQVAGLANMPQYQYTALFQQLTGKKPLDYLNAIRIERAKEWLRNSSYPLREIAEQTGFRDEYYFSRRFRQCTGQTPRQYAESSSSGTVSVRDWIGREVEIPIHPQRIIFYGETYGDLQELGISTVAGSNLWQKDDVLKACFQPLEGGGFDIDTEQLTQLQPDLIILGSSDILQCNKAASVAPTVTFNTFAPLEQRLLKLGDLLGRRTTAERWLKSYSTQRTAMWQRVHETIPIEESAAVFIVDRQRLFVMGTVGLTVTLYHESGFQVPPRVADILRQGISFLEITPDQLADYAGDRMFIVLTHDHLSREQAYQLADYEIWARLEAVRQGKAYWVEEMEWNFGDAHTSSLLIDRLPALLLDPLSSS
ncbi:HTH-type transcriptional activator Btr [compost metagenome]